MDNCYSDCAAGVFDSGVGLIMWPRNVTLTWKGAPATTQTITWQTGRYTMGSKVEYTAATDDLPPLVMSGSATQLETDGGLIIIHSTSLTGLKPGTSYRYRVGDGLFWSPYHTFTTAPARTEPFKFLLFGDSQGSSYRLWQETLHAAYERNRDAAFMLHIGDLVDIGLNYKQWDDWFQAGRGVIDTIPVVPVMGNHETYTTKWEITQPLLYTAFFRLPGNGPEALTGKVYSFDYGDVHFSILDSQLQEEAEWIPEMLTLQKNWLEKDLAGTEKRWKLVFLHRPVYHNRSSEADQDLRDAFTPLFDRYHVDAVFAGHDHVYARSYPLADGVWNGDKGNGPVYFTIGRSGESTFARAQPKDWNAVFYNPLDQPNYMTVEASAESLLIKVFKLNGDMIDMWSKS
ncbi:hypothetical protein P22_2906 [Propionispora sp. 2/2-37]|uniref:purple acid phosphatase family protein n=1 Tax=Propionispora sp. 2/2-37 TaxID=1677858 RepID=UPI0006BB7061|nr:metallophosphoesterase family protein [Propionispora sp. 2/2-37]CUH96795.1 hypothetical protein P22_2906 [Propionispora sp. 2/2-37]